MEKALAEELADGFVPLQAPFDKAMETQAAPLSFSNDGVHPSDLGARLIAREYVAGIAPIVEQCISSKGV